MQNAPIVYGGFVPVVIVQTDFLAYFGSANELERTRFRRNQDWCLFRRTSSAERQVIRGHRQLLIVGTHNDNRGAMADFVCQMKQRNKGLRAALFSSVSPHDGFVVGGPYDVIVRRDEEGSCSMLVEEVRFFLTGSRSRQVQEV